MDQGIGQVNFEDRQFVANYTQNLSSSDLATLLDVLFHDYPEEVVERKGSESYHIDVGTLSPNAFNAMRQFVKRALKDDDENTDTSRQEALPRLTIPESLRQNSLSSLPYPQNSLDSISDLYRIQSYNGPDLSSPRYALETMVAGNESEKSPSSASFKPVNQMVTFETTPLLPLPLKDAPQAQVNSIHVPLTKTPRLKRHRESDSTGSTKSDASKKVKQVANEGRYYNGERVWRKDNDQVLEFNGVKVKLLNVHNPTNRPWVCQVCDRDFVSKDKIVNHVQQHSGEKVHECKICHNKFSSKHYLKEHERRVHQFDCHHCHKIFDSFEELHEHALKVHPGLDLVKCSCHKGCANSRCSCFKSGLNCGSSCICMNCNNRASDVVRTGATQQMAAQQIARV